MSPSRTSRSASDTASTSAASGLPSRATSAPARPPRCRSETTAVRIGPMLAEGERLNSECACRSSAATTASSPSARSARRAPCSTRTASPSGGRGPRRCGARARSGPVQAASGVRVSRGEFASAGPYEDGREVRLEKVPGGLRLASWHAGQLVKDAPVLALGDLPALLELGRRAGPAARSVRRRWRATAAGAATRRSARTARARAAPASSATSCAWSASTTTGCGSRAGSCGRTGGGSSRRRRCFCRPDRFLGALGSAAERGVLASGDPVE